MRIVADAHIPYVKEYFAEQGELILKPGREITRDNLKIADLLLVRSITPVGAALLKGTPVKFVGSVTAGADHLDTKWLQEAGISFCVAAGFNAPPVADYVTASLVALIQHDLLPHSQFKAGVIGAGHVGKLVIEKLKLLDCEVVVCDPLRKEAEKDFFSTSLERFTDLDFITIHVPLTHVGRYPTYHFIGRDFLRRQKPGCVLLNASRGAVINSAALLKYGRHLTWCMDVWENEPCINLSVLESTFLATPHIAGYSKQSKMRGIQMIYQAACARKMVQPRAIFPMVMPIRELEFGEERRTWQAIVMEIFNPLEMTAIMQSRLSSAKEIGSLFDEMRNQFNDRYEFSFTKISTKNVREEDRLFLKALGFLEV